MKNKMKLNRLEKFEMLCKDRLMKTLHTARKQNLIMAVIGWIFFILESILFYVYQVSDYPKQGKYIILLHCAVVIAIGTAYAAIYGTVYFIKAFRTVRSIKKGEKEGEGTTFDIFLYYGVTGGYNAFTDKIVEQMGFWRFLKQLTRDGSEIGFTKDCHNRLVIIRKDEEYKQTIPWSVPIIYERSTKKESAISATKDGKIKILLGKDVPDKEMEEDVFDWTPYLRLVNLPD